MAYVESGESAANYPFGTCYTRCYNDSSVSAPNNSTNATITVKGAVTSGKKGTDYGRLQLQGVRCQVGHAYAEGVNAAWHENTGRMDLTNWVAYKETSYTFPRRTYAYNVQVWTKYWGDTLNGAAGAIKQSGEVYQNVTVPALWSHTVKYNANGGSGAPGEQTKWYGSILTLSSTVPTRTGYTFKGWSTSNDSTVEYAAGGKYGADENVTLYAVWQINTYTVTFKSGYGNNIVLKTQTVNYNSNATPPSAPTRTGYTFAGWSGSYTNVTSNRTITAKWTINKYYVDVNGSLDGRDTSGTSPMGTFDMYINNSLAVNDATDYYQQQNYQTAYKVQDIKVNTGYDYTGATGSLSGTVPAGNVSVRLNFATKKYTVSFNANLGEAVSNMPSSFTKTHFVSIKLPTNIPTSRRYEFLGWSTSANGAVKYKPGDTYSAEGNATLYAIWKLRASVLNIYDSSRNRRNGLLHIYNDDGELHYGIMFVYGSDGRPHEVV